MINTLENYISNSLPVDDIFSTNPSLVKKVSQTGAFLPYYGNTVVFDLDDNTKRILGKLQEKIYRQAGWMLSRKLEYTTFHMTLHDLVNGPEYSEELRRAMVETETQVKRLLSKWNNQPPLHMKGTWLFNMVNTSLVLGLAPADGDSWNRLEKMYTDLESIVPLGYALTPHITLAYLKPGRYTEYDLKFLREALQPVTMDIELRFENLVYQEFTDMNHYSGK